MLPTSKGYQIFSIALSTIIILGIIICGIIQAFEFSARHGEACLVHNYLRVLQDKDFLASVIFSLIISILSTVITLIIGVFIALEILKRRKQVLFKIINDIPIYIPHIMVALFVIIVFSQTGYIARILYHLNIIKTPSEFINLVNDKYGIGIIIAYLYKGIPFATLVIYTVLLKVKLKEIHIALMLKATKFQVIKYIILPKIKITLFNLFIVIFVYNYSSYEIPSLLGHSQNRTVPVYIYDFHSSINLVDKSYAMAMNIINILITLFIISIVYFSQKVVKKK